jgi:hypothetical protein
MLLVSCSEGGSLVSEKNSQTKKQFLLTEYNEHEFSSHGIELKEGVVRSPKVAFGIAEAVLKEIYGDDQIERQKPFHVSLKNNVWYVKGSVTDDSGYVKGGVFEIEISKIDGKIIRVSHGK